MGTKKRGHKSSPVLILRGPNTVLELDCAYFVCTILCVILWQTLPLFQAILIFTWVDFKPTRYNEIEFPGWADGVGWMISLTSIMAIPTVMVYKIIVLKRQRGFSIIEVGSLCVYNGIRVVEAILLFYKFILQQMQNKYIETPLNESLSCQYKMSIL